MAREFSSAMEDAAKESGVNDVASDLRKATSAKSLGLDAVRNAATKFENWDPMRATRFSEAESRAEEVKHSAASVAAVPPAAETLKPVPPAPKPVSKPARPLPQPARRRKVEDASVQRRPTPRKPLPKKHDT